MSVKEINETVTATMARWAASLDYKDVAQDAAYQAKRFLLDSVGCALGGYQQHDVKIALELLDEIAAPGPATVIGTGKRVDAGFSRVEAMRTGYLQGSSPCSTKYP